MWHFTDPKHAILLAEQTSPDMHSVPINKIDHAESTERLARAIRLSHTISQAITFLQRPINHNGMSMIFNVRK